MEFALLQRLNLARRQRQAVVVATELGSEESTLFREADEVDPQLADAVLVAFRSGQSQQVETGAGPVFLNAHLPPPRLVIIGAVHISQALAPMATLAGLSTEIIDPRTAFATEARFGGVDLRAEWPDVVLREHPLDAYTAVAALTHDPKIDDYPLKSALEAGCFYVGALGSRKTHAKRVERLREAGLDDRQIERISAPIGLDIGASSPAEIAVAVLADIIQALRRRDLSRS